MKQTNQDRLLILRKILLKETDEWNQFSVQDLIEKLHAYLPDMKLDPRTIRTDMEKLQENEFEIEKQKGEYGKTFYSHQSRLFETHQLRLLIDAILFIEFMDEKEKHMMVNKIKSLASQSIAKTLPSPNYYSPITRVDYELVQNTIEIIHEAISRRDVLRYRYGQYNLNKRFEYSHDGGFYEVEPYELIWKKDNYYLIGKFVETGDLRHYRIDRIRDIELMFRRFKIEPFEFEAYIDKSFNMFSEEEIEIKILFDASLINIIIDQFGLNAHIEKVGENSFIYKGKAKTSEDLMNWILSWGTKAKVLEPSYLVEEVSSKIKKMHDMYNLNI